MQLNFTTIDELTDYFDQVNLLPANARQHLREIGDEKFVFQEQLAAAESIHLHIKVADVDDLPHNDMVKKGGQPKKAT